MGNKPQSFDAARGSLLKGVSLIEASAGTGKTYAIAMLVLRSIVELNIDIDKILIVTFTKAATEELRNRIRMRLVEGRDLLKGTLPSPDATLVDWAAGVRDKKRALSRLKLALYDIDRAAIFTIHSFCQRMLVDQALESGQLFDVELLADISQLRTEVADDFWRRHVYSLDQLPCSVVLEKFTNPEKLLSSVEGATRGVGQVEPVTGSLESALAALETAFEVMSTWWQKYGSQLFEQLEETRSAGGFKKKLTESLERYHSSLDMFFSGTFKSIPADLHLLQGDEIINELNGRKYRGESKKRAVIESWNLPGRVIDSLLEARDYFLLTLRVQLARELHEEVEKRLTHRGSMSFDDLITRLSRALQGERGEELKRIIQERFQTILIDEFQDTDSNQWFIFSKLFADLNHYLYLIGDPKQAIYKFRGADIYSYFQARTLVNHHLTLGKNFRSHPFLVEEVNQLFSSHQNPFFFEHNLIEYHPVQPAKTSDDFDLYDEKNSLAGMVYCLLPENEKNVTGQWTSGDAAKEFRYFVAAEITRLLGRDELHLRPGDIAVLVRSNSQAKEYLHELNKIGIPAIVSGRESVFNSAECKELFTLLQAVSQPGNLSYLKAAMALRWFGFTGNELVEIWQGEKEFNLWHERFLKYNVLWQKESFLVMMNSLIVDEDVYITMTSRQGSERSITNIQHLLELLQEAENSEHFHMGQTLLWLKRMMESGAERETGELRLESDEESVQIITMHGAKGLEYPIVFCPYLWYRSNRLNREKYCISSHDQDHNLIVDLGSDDFAERRSGAVREETAEDLRLLYVALTRAAVRCYVMWGDVKWHVMVGSSFESALGYLLFPGGKCSAEQQRQRFQEFAERVSAKVIAIEPDETVSPFHWQTGTDKLQSLMPSERSLHTDWQMSSYSALTALSEYEDEILSDQKESRSTVSIPVVGLPAGPNFGNIVHEILESIPFAELPLPGDHESLFQEKYRKYGLEVESEPLLLLLKNSVTSPLMISPEKGAFSLTSLSEKACLKEMGFYFHMDRLKTEMINTLLSSDPCVCNLSPRLMQGYLTGLIDLVCRYDGRYYIIDYKTNYLGDNMADYEPDKLIFAMRSHNYGLQYWIYTLVLHRYLTNMLPDYSYKDHFGGVFYLFVRGMTPDMIGNGVFSTVPDFDLLQELDKVIGGVDGE